VIDIHILVGPSSRGEWLAEALASVRSHPAVVHILENGNSVGVGRARGYALGGCPFVAALDADDVLMPGAVEACLSALADAPDAVGAFTDLIRVDADGSPFGAGSSTGTGPWSPMRQFYSLGYGSHFAVFRREALAPHLRRLQDFPRLADYVARGLVAGDGDWLHVPMDGYGYREHPGQVSRHFDTDLLRRALAVVRGPLLDRLGDRVETILKAVGVHQAVKAIERRTGWNCGCARRKAALNRI